MQDLLIDMIVQTIKFYTYRKSYLLHRKKKQSNICKSIDIEYTVKLVNKSQQSI